MPAALISEAGHGGNAKCTPWVPN
eukprot:SAG31_NODE_30461_length_381_cov_0.549645_1_plen_23_part_10